MPPGPALRGQRAPPTTRIRRRGRSRPRRRRRSQAAPPGTADRSVSTQHWGRLPWLAPCLQRVFFLRRRFDDMATPLTIVPSPPVPPFHTRAHSARRPRRTGAADNGTPGRTHVVTGARPAFSVAGRSAGDTEGRSSGLRGPWTPAQVRRTGRSTSVGTLGRRGGRAERRRPGPDRRTVVRAAGHGHRHGHGGERGRAEHDANQPAIQGSWPPRRTRCGNAKRRTRHGERGPGWTPSRLPESP